jgi:hypothetical protein
VGVYGEKKRCVKFGLFDFFLFYFSSYIFLFLKYMDCSLDLDMYSRIVTGESKQKYATCMANVETRKCA